MSAVPPGEPVAATLAGVVLDAVDARALAAFYRRLLGWRVIADEGDWVVIEGPEGGTHLSFASEPNYRPPVWPTTRTGQQMMLHLDFKVEDLALAHAHAVAVGARPTPWQPQEDVRVYTDPAGHPFCLFTE